MIKIYMVTVKHCPICCICNTGIQDGLVYKSGISNYYCSKDCYDKIGGKFTIKKRKLA